ncbi:hypothetical protein EMCRGX_G023210 [Ephydatia muelleri]
MPEEQVKVGVVKEPQRDNDTGLQVVIKALAERLGNLEAKIQSVALRSDGAEARSWERKPRVTGQKQQYRSTSETENRSSPTCYLCGKEGHIKRYCPLNFNGPTGKNDALDDRSRKSLTATSKTAIGANGLSLKVMGQVNIGVSLGRFRAAHTFIVVKDLTFECILGVDFLRSNKAVMDFRTNTLHLENESVMVPTQEETSSNGKNSIKSMLRRTQRSRGVLYVWLLLL